jgi:hypothetical protein
MLLRYIIRISSIVLFFFLTVSFSSPRTGNLPTVLTADIPAKSINTPALIETPTAIQKNPRSGKTPKPGKGNQSGQANDASQNLSFDVPTHAMDVILGRPTANSITVTLLSNTTQTVSISYGTTSGNYSDKTNPINIKADIPQSIVLENLQPDTLYYYLLNGIENTFHTARPSGSTFTFAIQADSHLDSNTNPQVYLQTLANERAGNPDFVIDLGDTFMTEKYKPYTTAEPQYLAQRYYMSQVAQTTPLFLVLGNHDGEGAPRGNVGYETSLWAAGMRTKYFPNPVSDGFYTGNTNADPTVGDLQDYYAWEWGDVLFVVLDPYWFTPALKGDSDQWNQTLGEVQYQWLKNTLETSHAKWKFIFIHQLIGGIDKNGRGGVETANLYEWGGNNADGTYGFNTHRPGWEMPIHQLLVANHVTAVFHGHDHLFAKEVLDGIIYQEVPQPGAARSDETSNAAEYGYRSGVILGSSGHLRITVTPQKITIDYIRTYLSNAKNTEQHNGEVGYQYTIE